MIAKLTETQKALRDAWIEHLEKKGSMLQCYGRWFAEQLVGKRGNATGIATCKRWSDHEAS